MQHNIEFWNALDELVNNSEIINDKSLSSSTIKMCFGFPTGIFTLPFKYILFISAIDTPHIF